MLPRRLLANLPTDSVGAAAEIEGSITVAMSYAWGTATRDAINEAYTSVFRTMILAGLVLTVVALIISLFIQDQNIKEVDEGRDYKGIVIGKTGAVDTLKEKVHIGHDVKSAPTESS